MITNRVNGKCYIGQTTMTLDRRWACHKSIGTKKPKHLISRAINRHGAENFTIEQICTAETREELNALEKRCIVLMDSRNLRVGYNKSPGGDGYVEHSDETRRKMSASQLGRKHTEETKRKIGEKSKGMPISEEHKQALSKARKGVPKSDEFRARRSQIMTEHNPFKGKKHSEETKQKMRAIRAANAHKPKPPVSEETREKLRQATSGRKHSPETVEKIRAYWSTEEARKKASAQRYEYWASQAALNG